MTLLSSILFRYNNLNSNLQYVKITYKNYLTKFTFPYHLYSEIFLGENLNCTEFEHLVYFISLRFLV